MRCQAFGPSPAVGAQQAIDGVGVAGGEKFTPWVGPSVFYGAGYIDRAWGHQGQQHMLIDRQGVFPVVVLLEIAGKPVRKAGIDQFDRLAKAPPRERRAATARVVRNHQRKPFILRPGPERRFAEARVPHDRYALGIDVGVGLEVVQCSAQAPGP